MTRTGQADEKNAEFKYTPDKLINWKQYGGGVGILFT